MTTLTPERVSLQIPAHLQEYQWRPARLEDSRAIHAMLVAIDAADGKTVAGTLADFEREFNDPWSPPETDSLLALTSEGEVAAYARVLVNPEPEAEARALIFGDVHPAHRGRGLGEFVLSWMEARGAERLQKWDDGRARMLRTFCFDTCLDRIALFERHGFTRIRYGYRMRRDLHQPLPEVMIPAGLALVGYRPELDERMWQAFNESFRDHWSFEPITYSDWQQFLTGRTTFRPDLSYLAMEGEEVAAFSFNAVSPEDNAREGIQQGWIAELGTRRPWRKRGLATALLATSMRAFKAAGLDYATLGVDTENPTGALRLYEAMGFVPFKRNISFGKYLS